MSQYFSFPWDEGIRVKDGGEGETEIIPKDERDEELIAQEIFDNKASLEDTQDENLNFYLNHKSYLKALGCKSNKYRYNFMIESPLPGSHFM
jgi:hypothetical protein